MANVLFEITKIKAAMKKAASGPVSFAFGVGKKPEEGQLAMHVKRSPEILARALKKEGFKSNRILVGTAQIDGPTLTVTCKATVSKAKNSIKYFLKKNALPKKQVLLIGPDGVFGDDVGDDPDGEPEASQPDTPSNDQDEHAAESTQRGPDIAGLVVLYKQYAGQAAEVADKTKRSNIKKVLQHAAGLIKGKKASEAAVLLEKIDAALQNALASTPEVTSTPDPKAVKLMEMLNKFRNQALRVTDDEARKAIEEDLEVAVGLLKSGSLGETTQALIKVRDDLKAGMAAATQSDPSADSAATAEAAIKPLDFAALQRRIDAVISKQPQSERMLAGLLGAVRAADASGDITERDRQAEMLDERLESWDKAEPLPNMKDLLEKGMVELSQTLEPDQLEAIEQAAAQVDTTIDTMPAHLQAAAKAYSTRIATLRARGDKIVALLEGGSVTPIKRAAHHSEIDQICNHIETSTAEMQALLEKENML